MYSVNYAAFMKMNFQHASVKPDLNHYGKSIPRIRKNLLDTMRKSGQSLISK